MWRKSSGKCGFLPPNCFSFGQGVLERAGVDTMVARSRWVGRSSILGQSDDALPDWMRFAVLTISFVGVQLLWSCEMAQGEHPCPSRHRSHSNATIRSFSLSHLARIVEICHVVRLHGRPPLRIDRSATRRRPFRLLPLEIRTTEALHLWRLRRFLARRTLTRLVERGCCTLHDYWHDGSFPAHHHFGYSLNLRHVRSRNSSPSLLLLRTVLIHIRRFSQRLLHQRSASDGSITPRRRRTPTSPSSRQRLGLPYVWHWSSSRVLDRRTRSPHSHREILWRRTIESLDFLHGLLLVRNACCDDVLRYGEGIDFEGG